MNSLMYLGPTFPYERTFDGLIDIKPLVFRLHSFKYCKTIFDTNKKVLRASRHALEHRNDTEDPSALEVLAESPLSLTPDEESNAVERHITSWVKKSKEPSNFISLTFDVLFVLWEWKRRRFYQTHGSEDDFTIIVFKSSALRGRAKLGVEMLRKDHHAYQLADFNEEVVVASSIESSAILGHMPMSQLEVFIPSWCREALTSLEEAPVSEGKTGRRFRSFLDGLRPPTHQGDDHIRQSLCFALELLVLMLTPAEQQRTDDGRVLYSAAKDHPRDESELSVDHPSCANIVEQTVTETAGNLAAYRRQSRPPSTVHSGSTRPGTIHGRACQRASTLLGQYEEAQHILEDAIVSVDAGQGGQDSERLRESMYVGALAADISCMKKWKDRKILQKMCTELAYRVLSEGRRSTIEGVGGEPLETYQSDRRNWPSIV